MAAPDPLDNAPDRGGSTVRADASTYDADADPRGDEVGHDSSLRDGKRLKHLEQGYWSDSVAPADRTSLLSTMVNAANTMITLSEKMSEGHTPLIYVNRYFCEFTGYEPEEILDRDCRFLQYRNGERVEEGNEESRVALREAIREGTFVRLLLRNFKKDGTEFRNELYLSPVEGPDGEVRYFAGVQNDVTQRAKVIDRLRESEASLTATFAASPVALSLVERRGDEPPRHLRVNPSATRLLLRDVDPDADAEETAERCVGKSLEDLGVPGPLSDWLRDAFDQLAAGGITEPLRTRLDQVVHGERRHLAISAAEVDAGADGARRFCYTAEDLTEFDELESERALLRAAVRQTDVPTLLLTNDLDPPGPTIQYANAAATTLSGRSGEELTGELLTVLDGPGTDPDAPDRMRRSLREDGRFHGEAVVHQADGTPLTVEWDVSAVRDPAGATTHYVATFRDLRGRRELEGQVLTAQTREQARIARDLHDGVAQQLAGLTMLCASLKDQVDAGEDISQVLESITGAVRGAAKDLRGVAHGLMPLDPRRGGLADGLRRLAALTTETSDAEVAFEQPAGPVEVESPATAHHLYRIAQEAVSNAVRHGGASRITLTLTEDGPNCGALVVTDDGSGVDSDRLAPENVDPDRGIGLTAMRFRAQAVHGRLRFEPVDSGGLRVVCEFPRLPAD